jgi:hypothetical protein
MIIMTPMKSAKIFAIIIFFSLSPGLCQAQGMHPEGQIARVKEEIKSKNPRITKAYKQLLIKADSALVVQNHALEDFSVPGRYKEPEQHKKNSQSLQVDAFNAYACALAYRLSGKEIYGQKACELLDAWAVINKKYSDNDGPLVMAYSGTGLLNAALLLKKQPIWKESDQLQFAQWVKQVYNKSANEIRYRKNNWADWGRLASLLSAVYLEDKAEINKNIELIKSDLTSQISADGSMPEETKRGENGIWYTYFALAPITASAWIIYNETGEDLFHQEIQNAGLKKALDYLLRYSKNPEQWPHFNNPNKPAFSANLAGWPFNLFDAMGGIYGDKDYVQFASKYRPVIYDHHHFAWSFPTLMPCELKK